MTAVPLGAGIHVAGAQAAGFGLAASRWRGAASLGAFALLGDLGGRWG